MKRFVILILCILIAAGVWWTFHRRSAAPGGESGGGAGGRHGGPGGGMGGPVPVQAGVVKLQDVPIYLDGLGTVQAFNNVTIHSRVDGELQKVAFVEGQDVKAGDLLAIIDPRPYQAQLDEAVAKKAQDVAQLGNAQLVLERNADLLKKKVLDQQTYDTSKFAAEQMLAAVQADQAAIENAQTQLSYTSITSPIDGRTGVRLVDQGNIVHAADTTGIVIVAQLKPISLLFTLPEQNLPEIKEQQDKQGRLAVFALDQNNTSPLGEGELTVIDNQIDPTTATVRLKATFPNAELKLWPGQFVNARLLLETRKGGITVPSSVVQRGPNGVYAYVINPDKTVEMRPIKVAQTEANVALIDEGLKPGEQVVVDGQYKLQPGSKVEIVGSGGPGGSGKPGRASREKPQPTATPKP